jgi:streptogramin lyase
MPTGYRALTLCALLLATVGSTMPGPHRDVRQNGNGSPYWRIFEAPESQGIAMDIASGPDGAIWASNATPPGLLRIGMDSGISIVPLPFAAPGTLTAGTDGRLWLTDFIGGGVFDIAAYDLRTHVLTAYLAEGKSGDFILEGSSIASVDGWVWYCEEYHVAAMSVSGRRIREYPYPSQPSGGIFGGPYLTIGADHTIWFSDGTGLGRLDPRSGKSAYVPLPVAVNQCTPVVTTAADGAIFAYECGYFERIDPRTGKGRAWGPFVTRFYGMAAGPDGNIYFAPAYPAALGSFNPRNGALSLNFSPNGDGAGAVTVGSDGNVWSVMGARWAIGAFILNRLSVAPTSVKLKVGASAQLTAQYSGQRDLLAHSSDASVVTVRRTGSTTFAATGVASGSATVTVSDGIGNSFFVSVEVHS